VEGQKCMYSMSMEMLDGEQDRGGGVIMYTKGSWKEVPRLTMRATSDDCLRGL
jgi:hypothetical protein